MPQPQAQKKEENKTSKNTVSFFSMAVLGFFCAGLGAAAFYALQYAAQAGEKQSASPTLHSKKLEKKVRQLTHQIANLSPLANESTTKDTAIKEMTSKINTLEAKLQETSEKISAVEFQKENEIDLPTEKANELIAQLQKAEERLQTLSQKISTQTKAFKKAKDLWGALSEVRTSFIKGQPFGEHFVTLHTIAQHDKDMLELINTLSPFKDKEPPTPIELLTTFKKLEGRLIQSATPQGQSFSDRLKRQFASLIIIRKKNETASDSVDTDIPSELVVLVERALIRGDVEQAILYFEKLDENTRKLGSEWYERARVFLNIQDTITQLDSDAITSFSLTQAGNL